MATRSSGTHVNANTNMYDSSAENDEITPEEEISYTIRCNDSEDAKVQKLENLLHRKPQLNINFQDTTMNTLLHYAVRKGQTKVIALLLENGATINDITNKRGLTPLDIAKQTTTHNRQLIVDILEAHLNCSPTPSYLVKTLSEQEMNQNQKRKNEQMLLGANKRQKRIENSSYSFVEETLNKQNYDVWLTQEDIANYARIVYEWNGDNSCVLFEVIGSCEQLYTQLIRYKDILKEPDKQSLTFIINLNANHWVTLVVTQHNQLLSAYYVNSFGGEIPNEVEDKLYLAMPTITINNAAFQQQEDGCNCGIFALENAKIINESIQSGQMNHLEEALARYKPTSAYLQNKRKEFAEALQQGEAFLNEREQDNTMELSEVSNPDHLSKEVDIETDSKEEEKYSKSRALPSTLAGDIYQLKLLMLFVKRGLDEGYLFKLATEMDAAEKFDDVVFQYTKENSAVWCYFQAKHKQEDNKKIDVGGLLTTDKNGEFQLAKYFVSYLKIENNPHFIGTLKEFTLYTNIGFDLDQSTKLNQVKKLNVKSSGPNKGKEMLVEQVKDGDVFLRDGGTRYKFTCTNKKMIAVMISVFKSAIKEQIQELEKQIARLQTKLDVEEQLEITKKWQDSFKQLIENKRKLNKNTKEFFNKLVFAVNQPNEVELGEIIKNELGKEFNNVDTKNVYGRFLEEMLDWMKERYGSFYSQDKAREFFVKIKIEILGTIWFDVKDPLALFTGREKELNSLHEALQRHGAQDQLTVISQMASISGLGGIGKTELARQYIHTHSKDYENVIWVNAENENTLLNTFLGLAKDTLGINTINADGKGKNIKPIINDVYNFIGKRKSLVIFDNAQDYRDIKQFLPPSLSPEKSKLKIILTSRFERWDEGDERSIHVIKLDNLSLEEAIAFIKKALGIEVEDNAHVGVMKQLAEELQYFPLALKQAVVYINQENIKAKKRGREKFDIIHYLEIRQRHQNKLLDKGYYKESDRYTKTVLMTWTTTLAKIAEDPEHGKLAIEILNILAYLASDKVPVEIIFTELVGDQDKLWEAIDLLEQYSMITLEKGQSNVHRLVQEVTRINLKDLNIEEEIIKQTFEALTMNFPYFSHKSEDFIKKKQLLPHLETVLSHIEQWIQTNPSDKQKIEKEYLKTILVRISDVYFDFCNPQKQKELIERVLNIKEEQYGPDHCEVAITLTNLGNAYGDLGEPQKQKELLERALSIDEKHYGPNHFEVAITLMNLANAYKDMGDLQKRKELLERALKIDEKHYGPDHFEVAKRLVNLGNAYGALRALGDPRRRKELLQWALQIDEQHYGPDHFEVAVTLSSLGNACGALGDPHKQKELSERALQIQTKHYGSEHFEVAITLVNLGNACGALGDPQKQLELLDRALKIKEKHYGPVHFEVAKILTNIGIAHGALGNVEKQRESLERALKIEETCYGPAHFEVATQLENLDIA